LGNIVAVAVHVKFAPLAGVKPPPPLIPDAEVLLIVSTVVVTFTVTVKLLLYTSSAAVGKDPVFQTVGSDQFPVLVAKTFAIINYL
jgi:hypothetical protein